MEYVQEITLDVNPNSSFVTVTAKQDDVNSRKLLIHFTKDGQKYEINSDRVWLRVRKPDGHVVLKEGTINKSKGTVEVNLTPQILAVPGRAYADIIEFNDSSNTSDTLSTASFIIIIQAQPSSPVFSSDDFLALKEFVDHGMSIIDTSTNLNSAGTWLDKSGTLYWGFSKEPVGESVTARLAAVEALAESSAQTAAESAATAEAAQSAAEEAQGAASALNDIGESTVIQGTNLFDGNFDESGYFNANGDQSSSTYKRTSKYYDVPENATKIYAYLSTQTAVFSIGFYDSTKTWLGAKNVNNATTKENNIPANSKYFRVYTKTDWNGNCTLATSYVNSYIPYVAPKNKFILNGAFKGKTIAFLGDSIIGNFNDYTGICNILAEITDATIINCAFGGTRMAYEHSAYGDATPGASGYIDGATDVEKNQVDQYRYWNTLSGYGIAQAIASGSWTAQENAVANMSSALDYFSARLAEIEAIDWTTIDYILWEYGTNDFATKVKVSDVNNPTNYFAFDNAYRKTIEIILTAYPKIKIIPITAMWRWWSNSGIFVDDSNTHTENDYSGTPRLLTSFVETAKDVAKENQLPCIDIYYNLGANKFNRLEFFNSTDETHPNADGRNKYANFVASQLNTLKTS